MYLKKTSAISLIETIITLSLVGLFSLMIFPTLFITNKSYLLVINENALILKEGRIIEVIEESIKKSKKLNFDYIGSSYISNSAEVLNYTSGINFQLNENFFKSISPNGNTLFLEIPIINNDQIEANFLIFQFINNELIVIEGELFSNTIFIKNRDTLIKNISGIFNKMPKGIAITIQLKNNLLLKNNYILKGYETFEKSD